MRLCTSRVIGFLQGLLVFLRVYSNKTKERKKKKKRIPKRSMERHREDETVKNGEDKK